MAAARAKLVVRERRNLISDVESQEVLEPIQRIDISTL